VTTTEQGLRSLGLEALRALDPLPACLDGNGLVAVSTPFADVADEERWIHISVETTPQTLREHLPSDGAIEQSLRETLPYRSLCI